MSTLNMRFCGKIPELFGTKMFVIWSYEMLFYRGSKFNPMAIYIGKEYFLRKNIVKGYIHL